MVALFLFVGQAQNEFIFEQALVSCFSMELMLWFF